MMLFMGLSSDTDITKQDIKNQMDLHIKIKIKLLLACLLTSNVKILSDPFIPMSEFDRLVSLSERKY